LFLTVHFYLEIGLIFTVMLTINLMGGLGNQLFQMFAFLSYCLKHGKSFAFSKNLHMSRYHGGERNVYWDSIFSNLKHFIRDNLTLPIGYREPHFHYSELPHNINDNTSLSGYYQSYQYFDHYKDQIMSLLHLKNLIEQVPSYPNHISLHFRVGDYKSLKNLHPIMPSSYYIKSLTKLLSLDQSVSNVIYFYEKDDQDYIDKIITKLSEQFPTLNFEPCDHSLKDWEQMLCMSTCKHNIIANSSFSWWGAYLNTNKEHKTCFPKVWFGSELGHDTKDLCPSHWISIEY
jgi:hypothetical protein